jgi:hypothetical protein
LMISCRFCPPAPDYRADVMGLTGWASCLAIVAAGNGSLGG